MTSNTIHHLIITQDHHYHNSFFSHRGQPPAEAPTRIRPRSKEKKDSSLESNAFNHRVLEKGGCGQRSQWTCRPFTFSKECIYRCTHICAHTHTTPMFLSRLTAACLTSIPFLLDVCIVPMFLNSHVTVSLTMRPQIA